MGAFDNFDWKDLVPIVAPLAPGLGSILGGFIPIPGGSYMGQKVGEMIAAKFGVPATPAAVASAITSNPNEVVLAHLQAVSDEAKAMWPALAQMEQAWADALAKSTAEVNATMRFELVPENRHWFFTGWRPAAGWIFDFYMWVFGALLVAAGALASLFDKPEALKVLVDAWPIFAAYFTALAACVGVLINGRSKEKAAAQAAAVPVPVPASAQAPKKSGK